ncbi:Mitochondrial glycoprotein family protein [Striga hermonthica]|uniref:Mitochondrial glycoprotein family protein n=1 Tax=Striga hermonthica TaxID=68872 RepID=A0A9N7R3B8_STRHE|nr:Mitochondrial glycoprotein family protein [Striga hermonthica]
MALNNAIRRAASRVVPLVIRASAGGQRCLHHHASPAQLFSAVNCPSTNLLRRSLPSFIHRFSTKAESDAALLRVIEYEVKCAEESEAGNEPEEVPADFPFKIEDHPGQQTVTLSRDYQGEKVTVEVHTPDLTGNEDDDEDDDDDEEESASGPNIPLVVRISKKSGPALEFSCTAYSDEIVIDSLAVKDPEVDEEQIAYEGPDFADLDENLQKAFHKYLEIRGIKAKTTNFLVDYMTNKDAREYTEWLKNLQKFVEA